MRTTLQNPTEQKLQVLFSDRWQLSDLLEDLISYMGRAVLVVGTFSTGEEFLRRLHTLRTRGLVRSAVLYCDMRAAEKTSRLQPLLRSCFEDVNLCRNHSKVLLLGTPKGNVCVLTSQNMTRGNRMESYIVMLDEHAFGTAYNALLRMEVFKQWKSTSTCLHS